MVSVPWEGRQVSLFPAAINMSSFITRFSPEWMLCHRLLFSLCGGMTIGTWDLTRNCLSPPTETIYFLLDQTRLAEDSILRVAEKKHQNEIT